MNILEIRELTKSYDLGRHGKKRVLNEFSMNIKKGDIVGLLGDSGCGKSTIAKCITNIETPERGEIVLDGEIIFNKNMVRKNRKSNIIENLFRNKNTGNVYINKFSELSVKRKIQIIMQDPYSSLNPKKKVGKSISDGVLIHYRNIEKKDAEKKVKKCFEMCGLHSSFYDRYPHELSGGQRQRISIARALVLEPEIIVCDEITSALDVNVQAQILNLMLDLREELNLTYLFISHDRDVVDCFCNRKIFMENISEL